MTGLGRSLSVVMQWAWAWSRSQLEGFDLARLDPGNAGQGRAMMLVCRVEPLLGDSDRARGGGLDGFWFRVSLLVRKST